MPRTRPRPGRRRPPRSILGSPTMSLISRDLCPKMSLHFETYQQRDPQSCVLCNPRIKFGVLLEAAGLGRITWPPAIMSGWRGLGERFVFRRRADTRKDKSYVLYSLRQNQLAHVMFPWEDTLNNRSASWPDNMVCGAGEIRKPESVSLLGTTGEFLFAVTWPSPQPGNIVDVEGRVLGRTTGLPGIPSTSGKAWESLRELPCMWWT